mmetsp:Transcript_114220/g.271891  ORF Transcript_114220/g.271891 Transcript_114220/m.271891 type:complete len:239 (+) Transcript_114220:432-1148(+)
MSLTSLSAFCALPSAARMRASSKLFAEVSMRAKPKKVPPPQAVPPTRTKSPGAAESTRRIETPVPVMTKIIGNSGSGHGLVMVAPSSVMVKMSCWVPSPLLPPVPSVPVRHCGGARSKSPSTIAAISRTGSSSTRNASRKRGANLQAPPPAVAMRLKGRSEEVKTSSDQLENVRVNLGDSPMTSDTARIAPVSPDVARVGFGFRSPSSESSSQVNGSLVALRPKSRRRSPKWATAISS